MRTGGFGQAYDADSKPVPEEYRVCVYADSNSEDYTNHFSIAAHKEPVMKWKDLEGVPEFISGDAETFHENI